MNRRYSSKLNGKRGGRPACGNQIKIELPDIEFIVLTPNQYGTLLSKYGYKLLEKALEILERWLKSSPEGIKYKGKNNYAHFRSDGWLINEARQQIQN